MHIYYILQKQCMDKLFKRKRNQLSQGAQGMLIIKLEIVYNRECYEDINILNQL